MPKTGTNVRHGAFRDDRLNIALGRQAGCRYEHLYGSNPDIGITPREDLWTPGGLYPWPTSAQRLFVSGDSIAHGFGVGASSEDASGNSGAQSVELVGLDDTFSEITEDITPNGTLTSLFTKQKFIRLNRASVKKAGTYTLNNEGDIHIHNAVDGNLLGVIEAEYGETQMSIFTIPKGFDAAIVSMTPSVSKNREGNVRLYKREAADLVADPFEASRVVVEVDSLSALFSMPIQSPIGIPEKTDLWGSGILNTAPGQVGVAYDIVMVPNA